MKNTAPTPLENLARHFGIEPEWRDNWKVVHPTTPETAAGLLAAMGVHAETPEEIQRSFQAIEEQEWTTFTPPVIVIRSSEPSADVLLHLPRRRHDAVSPISVFLEITEEGGWRQRCSHEGGAIRHLGSRPFKGRTWDRFAVPLPGPFPPGYHRLRVTVAQNGSTLSHEIPLIGCPDRTWMPPELEAAGKAAGLAVALYGLRSARDGGAGDFGDLRRITSWAVEALGVSFIGLNPLHAIRNRTPYSHSPYLPLSSLFYNFLYLDFTAVPEFAECAEARRLAAAGTTQELLTHLRSARYVPYEKAARLKSVFLRLLFTEFLSRHWHRPGPSSRRKRFENYLAREGEPLERFALFSAIEEHFAATGNDVWSWQQWPAAYHRPDAAAVRGFLDEHREEVLFHQYVQWQLDEQIAGLDAYARRTGLTLGYYHDLAMAVDEHGADYWAAQDLFATGARVGAPPDDFNVEGQDWGFPPPHPERDYARGYPAFAEQLRRACRHAGMLRIDHVMRLARLFWIPEGMKASSGAYVRYRFEDLLGIVALESVRNRTVIVGEDLGIVPEGFRERMDLAGGCSCRILYFERHDDGRFRRPEEYPRNAMVSINTHDLPTFAGFWSGDDLETRRRIGLFRSEEHYTRAVEGRRYDRRRLIELLVELELLPRERLADPGDPAEPDGAIHNAVVGLLCRMPSRFCLLSLEDIFKLREQQNIPGTVAERPNWVRRMPCTIEELSTDPAARDYAEMYRSWIARNGRSIPRHPTAP